MIELKEEEWSQHSGALFELYNTAVREARHWQEEAERRRVEKRQVTRDLSSQISALNAELQAVKRERDRLKEESREAEGADTVREAGGEEKETPARRPEGGDAESSPDGEPDA